MQRAFNLRLVTAALLGAVALVSAAYAVVQHWIGHTGGLSMRSCTEAALSQAQQPETVLYVNCGGFLQ